MVSLGELAESVRDLVDVVDKLALDLKRLKERVEELERDKR